MQDSEVMVPQIVDLPQLPAITADAVLADMAEDAQFADRDRLVGMVEGLLQDGQTLKDACASLKIRPTTLFRLADPERLRNAAAAGRLRRRAALAERLETIADVAVEELLGLIRSTDITPQRKIEAIALVLEHCGITPKEAPSSGAGSGAAGVEIEFDERLRTIRAMVAARK